MAAWQLYLKKHEFALRWPHRYVVGRQHFSMTDMICIVPSDFDEDSCKGIAIGLMSQCISENPNNPDDTFRATVSCPVWKRSSKRWISWKLKSAYWGHRSPALFAPSGDQWDQWALWERFIRLSAGVWLPFFTRLIKYRIFPEKFRQVPIHFDWLPAEVKPGNKTIKYKTQRFLCCCSFRRPTSYKCRFCAYWVTWLNYWRDRPVVKVTQFRSF
jgi:hypothetical protein